jgi:hypothetical protein
MKISTLLDHIDSGHIALPEFSAGTSGTVTRSGGYSRRCITAIR